MSQPLRRGQEILLLLDYKPGRKGNADQLETGKEYPALRQFSVSAQRRASITTLYSSSNRSSKIFIA